MVPLFQGRDPTKTLNIAVSSRALFDLEEENQVFVENGLDEYIKLQVSKENEILRPGSAFSFIKVNTVYNVSYTHTHARVRARAHVSCCYWVEVV